MPTSITREPRNGAGTLMALFSSVSVSNATGLLTRAVRWCITRQKARAASRLLHVEESVSLGQKRFAAVIRVENARYLVGGGANDVVLLAALGLRANAADDVSAEAAQLEVSSADKETAPAFREVLESASFAKATNTTKPAAGRSKGGAKQCA